MDLVSFSIRDLYFLGVHCTECSLYISLGGTKISQLNRRKKPKDKRDIPKLNVEIKHFAWNKHLNNFRLILPYRLTYALITNYKAILVCL